MKLVCVQKGLGWFSPNELMRLKAVLPGINADLEWDESGDLKIKERYRVYKVLGYPVYHMARRHMDINLFRFSMIESDFR